MQVPAKFTEFLAIHVELDDVFLLHQEALLLLDLEAARELLAIYRGLLDVHMRHEEQVILDLFDRAGPIKKWPRVLYTGQHEKMLWHLERMATALDGIVSAPGPQLRRTVLELLDTQATYKHLLEHHDGAEREGLFPITDGVVPEAERAEVIGRLWPEWRAAIAAVEERVGELRGVMDSRQKRLAT